MKIKKIILALSNIGLVVPSITITAGCLASCGSTTSSIKVTKIEIASNETSLEIGGAINLTSTVSPENANNKTLTWVSDNNQIATIDSAGKLTAISSGTCNIVAKSTDGSNITSNSIKITVVAKAVKITNISLSTTIKGYRNNSIELTPTITPANATNKELEWTLEDSTVATLEKTTGETNKITFVKNNSSTNLIIKAKDGSGISKTVPVTVDNDYIITDKQINKGSSITSASFDQTELSVQKEIDISYITNDNYFVTDEKISITYGDDTLKLGQDYFIDSIDKKIKIPGYILWEKYHEDWSKKLTVNIDALYIVPTTDSAETYMDDRTFAIARDGTTFSGTCWILADSTPTIANDYYYYIATNRHVRALFEENTNIAFAQTTGTLSSSDWYSVGTSAVIWESDSSFEFPLTSTKKTGVDFFVANADLSALTSNSAFKTKLDKLNDLTLANKPITKIARMSSKYVNYSNVKLNVLGYSDGSYKCGSFSTEQNDKIYYTSVNSSETIGYTDVYYGGKQYSILIGNSPSTRQFIGGSSGSMVVSKLENQWQVVGILYGGSTSESSVYQHLYIFNDTTGDFVSNYIKIK